MLVALGNLAQFDATQSLIRFLHIAAAILAAGGALYQFFALHPALQSLDAEQRVRLREAVVDRWRPVVIACIVILLATGLINFGVYRMRAIGSEYKMLYHMLFGVKTLAALAVFHASAVLILPGEKGRRYRDRAKFWLALIAAMLTIIIAAGAVMRYL